MLTATEAGTENQAKPQARVGKSRNGLRDSHFVELTPTSYLLPLKSIDGQEHMLALHEGSQLRVQHKTPCALRFSELIIHRDGHGWVEDLRHLALPT